MLIRILSGCLCTADREHGPGSVVDILEEDVAGLRRSFLLRFEAVAAGSAVVDEDQPADPGSALPVETGADLQKGEFRKPAGRARRKSPGLP